MPGRADVRGTYVRRAKVLYMEGVHMSRRADVPGEDVRETKVLYVDTTDVRGEQMSRGESPAIVYCGTVAPSVGSPVTAAIPAVQACNSGDVSPSGPGWQGKPIQE